MTKKESEKRIRDFSAGLSFIATMEFLDEDVFRIAKENGVFPKKNFTVAFGTVEKATKSRNGGEDISCEYQIQISYIHKDSSWLDEREIVIKNI